MKEPINTRANSLSQEEALELMWLSADRLAAGRANARAYRVAATVWRLTVPFNKGWDAIFVEEIGRLANMGDPRAVRRAIKECVRLGALEWEPNRWIPPKGQPGRPSHVGLPGAPKRGSERPHLTDAKRGSERPYNLSVEVMSVELNTHDSAIDVGTCRSSSSLIGAQGHDGSRVEGLEAHHLQALTREELARLAHARPEAHQAIKAEMERRERFAPHHGDERTGDTTGEGERSLMDWAGANPTKARQRRIREAWKAPETYLKES